ncbi:MAG: Ppx/GppA family phosphatase [Solirubrobacteraceae bacterium]|jgi:exopolyphosphatase/guanosine-5'-triphosphate,3'-diphosphate pyrophosphatase|nr:Ppx/GppA family phosphatase [Solirubrobacteraceae bacterium]
MTQRTSPTSSGAPAAGASAAPARFGVVDIGSNAIRLQIIELRAPGAPHVVLETRREPVRLGQDVFVTGTVPEPKIAAAVDALKRFRQVCDRMGVRAIRAVATSALREASNGSKIVRRIEEATGIHVEIISGTEEAYLLGRAVETKLDLARGRSMLVDLGGGSVEVTLVEDGQIVMAESYRLGAVRLLEGLRADVGGEGKGLVELLDQYVGSLDRRIAESLGRGDVDRFAATGGNIEALADLSARDGLLRQSGGVDALKLDDLGGWIQRLARLSYAERAQDLGLSPDRADVILPAAVVYYRLAGLARVDRILVPRVGLRDGLVRDVVAGHLDTSQAADRRETVVAAARALARKYHSEDAHIEKVRELAVSIFDQIQPLHGLGAEERVLLEAAALLHDIGAFVSASAHHKHAHYLIRASDVVGLGPDEREIVAQIARYHRRSHPKRSHPPYMTLPRDRRDVVSKLAAILRLADALDREHQSAVVRVEAKVTKRGLELAPVAAKGVKGDLALERWAVKRKGTLFEEVFGLPVQVES